MFIDGLKLVHRDERREILECNLPEGSIKKFLVLSDKVPLGNHYHKLTTEVFMIVKGAGTIITQETTEGVPNGKPSRTLVKEGDVIHITPYTAHTFCLVPGSEMICFADRPFDPVNQDMYNHILI
jgi:mannose-6-phosphate isomerase-like protein (cupin superfamily)